MDLLTPAEAAALIGVTDRTLRKWAERGRIQRHEGPEGELRYSREELLSVRGRQVEASGTVPELDRKEPEAPESWVQLAENYRIGQAQAQAEAAALRAELDRKREELFRTQAEAAESRAAREERDFLRQQVEQHARAEAELRVLMLRQSEQIQALQAAQEQKALPEPKRQWWQAPAGQEGKKRPWWKLWG